MSENSQDWHITEDEDVVPVRKAKKKKRAVPNSSQMKTVSRRPAAIAGILIVVGIGVILLRGVDGLTGQVASGLHVTITTTGLEPVVITASPGEKITWKNEQEIPHYLISDTLCNSQNECMTTSTMFSGDETSYTIPSSAEVGAHTYFSPTDPSLIGTISIGGSAAPKPTPTPTPIKTEQPGTLNQEPGTTCYSPNDCVAPEYCSSLDDGILPGTCVVGTPPQFGRAAAINSSSSQQTQIADDVPKNPLLEAIERQLELDMQPRGGTGQAPGPGTSGAPAAVPGVPQNPYTVDRSVSAPPIGIGGSLQGDLQKPFRQPNTGSGTWLAVILGTITVWIVSRKAGRVKQFISSSVKQ